MVLDNNVGQRWTGFNGTRRMSGMVKVVEGAKLKDVNVYKREMGGLCEGMTVLV